MSNLSIRETQLEMLPSAAHAGSGPPSPPRLPAPTQDLPCADCRRRKVKCSKTEPCANCQRFGIQCVYADSGRIFNRRPPSTADVLARRVEELEELVLNLSQRPGKGNPTDTLIENIMQKNAPARSFVEGRLVFDNDRSRYLHRGFWAAMYEEVRDLKFVLRDESPSLAEAFLFPSSLPDDAPQIYTHPPVCGSELLVRVFNQKVDPFVKILHRPTLELELNHFRRGILARPRDFECQLFAVYALGLLPLCPTLIEYRFHESKKVLLSRYRSYVSQGLSQLHLTTSTSLSTLQTLLLYITLLFWTGEMLHASTLIGLAYAMAKRTGLNRDGAHFPLSPWQIELRRRVWHHLVLLDALCVENHGLQPTIPPAETNDTLLPQNQNDSAWDTSEFSSLHPAPRNHFSDTTISLIHYEIGSLTRFILNYPYDTSMDLHSHFSLQNEILRQARDRMSILYTRNLDPESNILHRLARDLFDHAFRRIRLMQLAPLLAAKGSTAEATLPPHQRAALSANLYRLAIEYCKATQDLMAQYAPHSLDWAVIRAFSWHSVATMLSMVLRHGAALGSTPEARAATHRIEELFRKRPEVEFLAGNDHLWEPLRMLRAELALRQALPSSRKGSIVSGLGGLGGLGGVGAEMSTVQSRAGSVFAAEGAADGWTETETEMGTGLEAGSGPSTSFDPALFVAGVFPAEGLENVQNWFDLDAFV